MYLSSDDSHNVFRNNKAWDFKVRLPKILQLEGEWMCAILQVALTTGNKEKQSLEKHLYLCSDMCIESFVRDTQLPVMNEIVVNTTLPTRQHKVFDTPRYVHLSRVMLDEIRVYLKDGNLQSASLLQGCLNCTLHLVKVG